MIRREDMSKEEWDAIQAAEFRAGLEAAQLDVLAAIVAGGRHRLAWVPLEELVAGGHDPVAIDEVVDGKLAAWWTVTGSLHVTLTEYGAWVMQVQILERLSILGEELEEDPYWAEMKATPPPLKLPKRQREFRCPWMDQMEDKRAEQPVDAVMIDEVSGDPVLLLGQTVKIDRRLGKGGAKQAKRRRAG